MANSENNSLEFAASEIREIALSRIEPDKSQIRKEFKKAELEALANSLDKDGQLQPIHITLGTNSKYKIVDGERRWRAMNILAGKQDKKSEELNIKAIFVNLSNPIRGIIDNLMREAYNPIEESDALIELKKSLDKNAKVQDIADMVGKSRSLIAEKLSLSTLPTEIKEKARVDSCVPLRALKKIATMKTDDKEKIKAYNDLHEKYASNELSNEKDASQNETEKPSKATRSLISATKRIKSFTEKLIEIKPSDADDKAKEEFVLALSTSIKTAQQLLDEISAG